MEVSARLAEADAVPFVEGCEELRKRDAPVQARAGSPNRGQMLTGRRS